MSEQKYGALADRAAAKHGVDPRLFRALVKQESGWNPSARSPVGAFGLTQVMPFHKADLSTPASQLDFGAQYLSAQLKKFGSPEKALAAYNAGPGAVQKYGGIPPYKETQNYVRTILGNVGSSPGLTGGGGGSSPGSTLVGGTPGYTSRGVAPVAGSVDPKLMGQIRTMMARQAMDVKRGKKPSMKRFAQMMKLARKAKAASQATSYQSQSRYIEGTPGVPAGHHPGDGHNHGGGAQITPGGGWGGSEGIIKSLVGDLGGPLKVTSAKRDRRGTASGGVSDHWVGSKNSFAWDIGGFGANPHPAADAKASQIVSSLGGPANWGKTGGNFKTTRDGYAYQVIYRSQVGGNHNDHIHVAARRLIEG